MAVRIHRPFEVTAFNANGIRRHRHELSKQLQDLHLDVALLLSHIWNPTRGSSFQIINFIRMNTSQEEEEELPLQWETAFLTTMQICLRLFQ
jgi:hypothetical protein